MTLPDPDTLKTKIILLFMERPLWRALSIHQKLPAYSLQAVYKELRGLCEQGIVQKVRQDYSINSVWVLQLQVLASKMAKTCFGASSSVPVLEPQASASWKFNNLLDMNDFWGHMVLHLMRTSGERVVYAWNPHLWFYLFQEEKEDRFAEKERSVLGDHPFRVGDPATRRATEERIHTYQDQHQLSAGLGAIQDQSRFSRCSGFVRRLLLSCLVDGDHTDTASHYGKNEVLPKVTPRWDERLAALDAYVSGLSKHKAGDNALGEAGRARQQLRDDLYAECREALPSERLVSCDAAVGAGKTTAVMAHLLKMAKERNFRHIFVVLPYTNIIRQSVAVYRKALRLPGETQQDMEAVVAEHHHQATFQQVELRGMATLWRAPIVVTTAVQFFETLASCEPAKLRKLHELPGSAIFIDEAHAALPADMWPICWNWLNEWANEWNGHIVLASGSLAEFWTLNEFRAIAEELKKNGIADVYSLNGGLAAWLDANLPVSRKK